MAPNNLKLDWNQGLRQQMFAKIKDLYSYLHHAYVKQFSRSLPFSECFVDRWARANVLGFGKNTTLYDNSFVFGEVEVGSDCWIGPYTVLDGSGGKLTIGNCCTLSTGVQIYTHDNVRKTLSGCKAPMFKGNVYVGSCTYVGPNVIISAGARVGHHCVVGANSLVKHHVPDYSIVGGNPARVIGKVKVEGNGDINFDYASA